MADIDDFIAKNITSRPADKPASAPTDSSDIGDFVAKNIPSQTADDPGGTDEHYLPTNLAIGAGKGLMSMSAGLNRGVDYLMEKAGLPAATHNDAISQWAANPQGIAQNIGSMGAKALPYAFQPELGFAGAATRAAGSLGEFAASRAAQAAAQAVPAVSRSAQAAQLAASALPTIGHFAERAGTGAIAGSIQDPSTTGAITGALGGIAPASLNMLVQNPAMQYILKHKARHLVGGAAGGALSQILGPMGWIAYPAMVWKSGPGGQAIDRAGHWIADQYGKVVGFIPERVARAIAGAGGATASQAFGGGDGQTDQADQAR